MPKSHLIEKYRRLVEEEENRIAGITRSRFARLRNIDTHPSMILGGQYSRHSQSKDSYEYLRQRYYRLKRINESDIKQATTSYAFDSWFSVFVGFMEFYGLQGTPEAAELFMLVNSMTPKQKDKFINMGLNMALRTEYLDMGKDVRTGTNYTIKNLIERIEFIKSTTK